MNLTARQEAFGANYQVLGNATQAAVAAGYSRITAPDIASEKLSKRAMHVAPAAPE